MYFKSNKQCPINACDANYDILTKLTRQIKRSKNIAFDLHDDPADRIKIGPIKAVRLG